MNDSISLYTNSKIPVAAIIGRPNVGKSTLFNRLIRKRRAITHALPGVTRDPIEETIQMNGSDCILVDTGGYQTSTDSLEQLVTEKTVSYLERAAVLVLLVEAQGITPEDEIFIEKLRPYAEKVIVAANKADNPELEQAALSHYSLGFQLIVPISATHNRNIDLLREEMGRFLTDITPAAEEAEEGITISLIGKPNTGKSTLLNAFLSEEKSIVSDIPGTTRDVIQGSFRYKDHRIIINDTAGIRRKNKVTEDLEYYSVNRAISSIKAVEIVLLLIDAEEGLTEQDKKIAALAVKDGKGIILVVNKWDMIEDIKNQKEAYIDRIRFLFPIIAFAPVVFISALYRQGIDELLSVMMQIWRQLHMEVQTAKLNKHLKEWTTRNPAPRNRKFQWKARYLVQRDSNPVAFLLFVNSKRGFPKAYQQYISNNIRKDFGFSKIPIRLDLRE